MAWWRFWERTSVGRQAGNTAYFKAVDAEGRSRQDPNFVYPLREGAVVTHPSPDRISGDQCGSGIHLAKTLPAAFKYVPKPTEVWLARGGIILGEGDDKIRTDSCTMVRKFTGEELGRMITADPGKASWSTDYAANLRTIDAVPLAQAIAPLVDGNDGLVRVLYEMATEHVGSLAQLFVALIEQLLARSPRHACWAYRAALRIGGIADMAAFTRAVAEAARRDPEQTIWAQRLAFTVPGVDRTIFAAAGVAI